MYLKRRISRIVKWLGDKTIVEVVDFNLHPTFGHNIVYSRNIERDTKED